MDVRDAREADAKAMAAIAGSPPDVMRNLVHDRTVRVAIEADSVVGLVSFDARDGTVHVTQLAGSEAARDRLLEEPVGFARREGMVVEVLVPAGEVATREAAEAAGFEAAGTGPQFEGETTTRYRLEPGKAEQ